MGTHLLNIYTPNHPNCYTFIQCIWEGRGLIFPPHFQSIATLPTRFLALNVGDLAQKTLIHPPKSDGSQCTTLPHNHTKFIQWSLLIKTKSKWFQTQPTLSLCLSNNSLSLPNKHEGHHHHRSHRRKTHCWRSAATLRTSRWLSWSHGRSQVSHRRPRRVCCRLSHPRNTIKTGIVGGEASQEKANLANGRGRWRWRWRRRGRLGRLRQRGVHQAHDDALPAPSADTNSLPSGDCEIHPRDGKGMQNRGSSCFGGVNHASNPASLVSFCPSRQLR